MAHAYCMRTHVQACTPACGSSSGALVVADLQAQHAPTQPRPSHPFAVAAGQVGLQRLLYKREVPGTTNPKYKQPSKSEVCPDATACIARIRHVAPFDHDIYREFAGAFDARVRALGESFTARLASFRKANAAYQQLHAERSRQMEARNLLYGEDSTVYSRSAAAPTEMHTRVPMGRLVCPLGDSPTAVEACQRVYADTPFRYNWRHTAASCCERIRACVATRLQRRRPPGNCIRWMPYSADPGDRRRLFSSRSWKGGKGSGWARMAARLNASLPELCKTECAVPADPEPTLTPPYRVPLRAEVEAAMPPRQHLAIGRAEAAHHFDRIGCNDTPAALVAGRCQLERTPTRSTLPIPTSAHSLCLGLTLCPPALRVSPTGLGLTSQRAPKRVTRVRISSRHRGRARAICG